MSELKKKKKKVKDFETPYSVSNMLKDKGTSVTKLSMLVMGLANIMNGQILKGLMFLAMEIGFIAFMIMKGFGFLGDLIALGGTPKEKIWNEAKGIFEYTDGDNTVLMLLYGVLTVGLIALFVFMWRTSVCSGFKAYSLRVRGKHLNNFIEDIKSLFNENLHKLLLTLPVSGIVVFTILPLIYMITMAFTSYSTVDEHLLIFDWVGLDNFKKIFDISGSIGKEFWSVLGWTLVWAVLATGLNYILGMILAIVINRKDTKIKGFWRFCFILSAAIPQFVSLLIMRSMLQQNGAINVMLQNWGLIDSPLPFLTDATWARATVVIINLWVGIPFTLLQVTGILQNIPAELYEAAKVDGANAFITFFKITLPYMLFVTTPYLITTFTGNVNNFNVIFLLSGGAPTLVGSTAGKTDLLVTWLYKLTVDKQYFNLGAVIGIMTFVVLAIVSLLTYRNTGSYKNEEGFM